MVTRTAVPCTAFTSPTWLSLRHGGERSAWALVDANGQPLTSARVMFLKRASIVCQSIYFFLVKEQFHSRSTCTVHSSLGLNTRGRLCNCVKTANALLETPPDRQYGTIFLVPKRESTGHLHLRWMRIEDFWQNSQTMYRYEISSKGGGCRNEMARTSAGDQAGQEEEHAHHPRGARSCPCSYWVRSSVKISLLITD